MAEFDCFQVYIAARRPNSLMPSEIQRRCKWLTRHVLPFVACFVLRSLPVALCRTILVQLKSLMRQKPVKNGFPIQNYCSEMLRCSESFFPSYA